VNREFDALADDFVTLGLLPPGSDKTEITPALTGVFQDALANGVNNLNFGDLSGSLGQTMYQYNFRIPPYYTLLVRSLSVLEVSSCYAQTSCAVFAEPMCTWPENRACACLLSIHHTHLILIVITSITYFVSESSACVQTRINCARFQVISQGSLIHLIISASTQSNAKIRRTIPFQSGGAVTTVPAVLGILVHRHRKQQYVVCRELHCRQTPTTRCWGPLTLG